MSNALLVGSKFGLQNVDIALDAALKVGIPIAVSFALLEKESHGRNIWGNDRRGIFKGKRGEVTEADYKVFFKGLQAGKRSNGVGPCQITHWTFHYRAKREGLKLWEPSDNMVLGFTILKELRVHWGSWQKAATHYNGSPLYGRDFAKKMKVWESRLAANRDMN